MRHIAKFARNLTIALTISGLAFGTFGLVTYSQTSTLMFADVGDQPGDPDVG